MSQELRRRFDDCVEKIAYQASCQCAVGRHGLCEHESMTIRRATASDVAAIWKIFQAVVAPGDTYAFMPDTTEQDALAYFLSPGVIAYVAELDGNVIGIYKLTPNHNGRGSHVANASFMVDPIAQGRGAGRALGEHCLEEARRLGYDAMQFNFVVSTNTPAVTLWQSLGFTIVGTLPKAFRHATRGDVDAYVMHRFL
jgi:L-amino acid N-acyltransferase YncA